MNRLVGISMLHRVVGVAILACTLTGVTAANGKKKSTSAANASSSQSAAEKAKAALEALNKADEARRARNGWTAKISLPKAKPAKLGSNPIDLSLYPTAAQCGECHKQIYKEWASSNHAYSSISPMFHKFEQRFQELTQGTVGTFCVRCHQQVGTQLGEKRETPLWKRSQISREGVTCITCHRVKEQYGKVNGERRVEPGKIFDPVFGSGKNSVIDKVLKNKETYTVATSEKERGNKIHRGMITNDQLSKSEFCVSCHQVAVNLGIKLEIVWDQYRDSPARKAGVTCQDCHMGKVPGKPKGYDTAPSAIVGGKAVNPGRKHANHRFIGPGYSIAHPGIFPHNKKAQAYSIKDWLKFDWRSGWGTTKFEDKIAAGKIKIKFPKRWSDALDREDARAIIGKTPARSSMRTSKFSTSATRYANR